MFATLTQSSNNSKNSAPAETFGEAGLLTSASPLGYLGNTAITFIAYAPPGAGDAEATATAPVALATAAERITRVALTAPANSFAERDWHFQLNQKYQVDGTDAPLVLIQKIELSAPTGNFNRGVPVMSTTSYYELIGTIAAGQVQTAAGVNDRWFAPPPPAQIATTLTPFGTISFPVGVTSGTITMSGQGRAFPANSPIVQAALGALNLPHGRDQGKFWYYHGTTRTAGLNPNRVPSITPGILRSSTQFTAGSAPAGVSTLVWNTQWVACETDAAGKFVFHQETVQFTMGSMVRGVYTAPVVNRTPTDVPITMPRNPWYPPPHAPPGS